MKIFEPFSIPNQAFAIGAKAMIGIALAAMKYGINAEPTARKRASTRAAAIPNEQPMTKPQKASVNVYHPAGQRMCRSSQNAESDLARLREQELLDPERLHGELPADQAEHEDASAGAHSRGEQLRPLQPAHGPASGAVSRAPCDSRSSSRTSVASSKNRVSSRVSVVRG